jgi:hypothetical protein
VSKKTQIERTSWRAYSYLEANGNNAFHVLTPNGAVIIYVYDFVDTGKSTIFECSAGGKRHEESHGRHYRDHYLITLANRFAARVQDEQEQKWRDQIQERAEIHNDVVEALRADHVKAIAELQAERDRWEESAALWQENFDTRVPQLVGELNDSRDCRDEARRECRKALSVMMRYYGTDYVSDDDMLPIFQLAAKYLKPEPPE